MINFKQLSVSLSICSLVLEIKPTYFAYKNVKVLVSYMYLLNKMEIKERNILL